MSINRVTLTGNLTRDPEVRTTAGGMPVLSFGIAVNDRVKNNQTGQWEDRPNFIDCTKFGDSAQNVAQYLSKGSKVAVEGRLRWHQWQDNSGSNRSKVDVVVDSIEFMQQASKPASQPAYAPQAYAPVQQQPAPQAAAQVPPVVDATSIYDEEIPF